MKLAIDDIYSQQINKAWNTINNLTANIESIQNDFIDGQDLTAIMQDLLDAYYIYVGRLEHKLDKPSKAPNSTFKAEEKPDIKLSVQELEEPETAEFEPINDIPELLEEPTIESEIPIEPFDYFTDFDEPDSSIPPLTDKDLYNE